MVPLNIPTTADVNERNVAWFFWLTVYAHTVGSVVETEAPSTDNYETSAGSCTTSWKDLHWQVGHTFTLFTY